MLRLGTGQSQVLTGVQLLAALAPPPYGRRRAAERTGEGAARDPRRVEDAVDRAGDVVTELALLRLRQLGRRSDRR